MKETKFKQTEVGMIPWDWDVVNLSTVYRFKYGFFNNNPDNGGPFPIYGANGVIGGYTNFNAEDSVVIGHIGTAGTVIWAAGKHFVTYNGTIADIRDKSANDSRFGYFQLLRLDIPSICNGSSQPFLAYDKLNVLKISLPPTIEEQQRIANALSDVDSLISNLEKLIAKKKNIKQGAMQQLLTGRKRLPGFGPSCHPERSTKCAVEGSSHFKMTELGPIPSDWEVKKLDDIMMLSGDSVLSSKFKRENYVGTENMLPEKAGVEKNISVNPTNRAKGFLKHDILISNIRPYLKKIWFADKNGCCSNDVLVIRVKDCAEISAEFCYSILSDDKFFSFVMENAVGTKMPRGDKKMIKEYLFVVPSSKAEQTAIANVLSDMDSEIQTLETKLAKYRKLKTGMMQQLLTGKIRLID